MQGQFLNNSPLLVQPQTAQQPISLKSQTLTPSKPLNASGKPASELIADSTPLHQVFVTEITFLTGHFLDHKQLMGWKLHAVACVLCAKYSCYIQYTISFIAEIHIFSSLKYIYLPRDLRGIRFQISAPLLVSEFICWFS